VWERGRTRHPALKDIYLARSINAFVGTNLGPWDLQQLDAATLELLQKITRGPSREFTAGLARIESKKNEIRKMVLH